MTPLLPDSIRARCIGPYQTKRNCVHLWSEISCRYYHTVPQTEPRMEVTDWVIVCVLVCPYASLTVGASLMQIMHYGLWKSLAAVQRYLEYFDAISPDTSTWLFFDWMTPPVPSPHTHHAPVVQQAPLLSLIPTIDLDDTVQALLESDDEHHRLFIDRHHVLSTCTQ
jgi:hypothetical protein